MISNKKFFRFSYLTTHSAIAFIVFVFLISGCRKGVKEITDRTGGGGQRPNIILILGDDIGYEIPNYTGGQSYNTPNINQLAHQGMQFTQGRAAPKCSPSRFMLMTGKYNFRNYTEWGVLNTSERTIANMLHDEGYATCVAGKWQFDGGDISIRKFGFDKYSVFLPFHAGEVEEDVYRYKNPHIYENGSFLPDNETNNKYADDIFADYICNFIDSNSTKPFFIYFSLNLAHNPLSPTPDDPEFATWNPLTDSSQPEYFPSMIQYMDKKVGQVVNKIKAAGLDNKTVILYVGDNGTTKHIKSIFNGYPIIGEKSNTTEYGIHVPLAVRWPNKIIAGSISNNLVDFTDFLPTFADIAEIPLPLNYGILDGLSFYPALKNIAGPKRSGTFCHYDPNFYDDTNFKRWVQNGTYKLYDSTYNNYFFNFINDIEETSPLPDRSLTPEEILIKSQFEQVFLQMHN